VLAQAAFDARGMLRNGEQLVLTLVLPLLVLVGLVVSGVPDLGPGRRVDVVTPGVLALAVMSTAFTGQAIGTGFDRRYGVLRLLATTPLGRSGLLLGRVGAVLAVEVVQVALLAAVALALGWRPEPGGLGPAAAALVGGTVAFVALGLLLAGALRAEAVLAAANLVWILLLAGGGLVVPPERTGVLEPLARVLPSGALGDLVRAALLDGGVDGRAAVVLGLWGLAGAAGALRWFRFDA
jgi:ABC-2 type transport system permease protein